jgi:NTP pyrophosphatase (non-canonical NTP hydrolase)
MQIDLNKYTDFVREVTSDNSNYTDKLVETLEQIEANKTENIALLLTAAIGLAAETGEFAEIPKKCVFQGKPLDAEARYHMKRELGDIFWYWTNACRALNFDPNDVIAENVRKLEARYPGGTFDPYYSENRKQGDL